MKLELFIAVRYLVGRKRSLFSLLTTIIAMAGISLGVASLIITLAVMTGFHNEIQKRILGLNPHILVMKTNNTKISFTEINPVLKKIDGIESYAPFIYCQVIVKSRYGMSGMLIKGIDFRKEREIIPGINTILTKGAWIEGNNTNPPVSPFKKGGENKVLKKVGVNTEISKYTEENTVVLGKELANNLTVYPGSELIVFIPAGMAGFNIPEMNKLKVTGIFSSGMYDYDSNLGYMNITAAERIFKKNCIYGIGIKARNIENTAIITESLRQNMKPELNYKILSWQELNRNLFSALKLEKFVMFLLLGLIIVVACFNIISNLLLLSMEKAKEIGILTAMGMKQSSIRKVFFLEGAIIGSIGTAAGLLLGVILCLLLKKYQFIQLPPDIYYINKLPVLLSFNDIISVSVLSLAITFMSTIYPAYKAGKLNPVEIIRYG